jgi:hypothetical protein
MNHNGLWYGDIARNLMQTLGCTYEIANKLMLAYRREEDVRGIIVEPLTEAEMHQTCLSPTVHAFAVQIVENAVSRLLYEGARRPSIMIRIPDPPCADPGPDMQRHLGDTQHAGLSASGQDGPARFSGGYLIRFGELWFSFDDYTGLK